MKLEKEVKIRVKDPRAMRLKLKEAGARHARTARQYDGIFDFRNGRLAKGGEVLRLRLLEPVWPDGERRMIVTFKGRRKRNGMLKSRAETEFETDDLGGALLAAQELGLEKKLEYLKVTEFYSLGKLKVTLDHFPHYREAGYFIELEGTEAQIAMGMKKLELNLKDAERRTYPEIISELIRKKSK